MTALCVAAMAAAFCASLPALAECYGNWPALVCIDTQGNGDTYVFTPGGSFHNRGDNGTAKYPNARAAPAANSPAVGPDANGASAVMRPGSQDGGMVMTPQSPKGGTVLSGSGGATVVTCGSSGTCK